MNGAESAVLVLSILSLLVIPAVAWMSRTYAQARVNEHDIAALNTRLRVAEAELDGVHRINQTLTGVEVEIKELRKSVDRLHGDFAGFRSTKS